MFENNYDYAQHAELSDRYRSGANWFYWIAGLTLVTSVISLLGGGWRFFLSLGITQIVDGIAVLASENLGEATKVIALVIDIFITAVFAGVAYLAGKKQFWAYLVGMILFGLDALLSIVIFDWIGIIVHGIVLVLMIRGYLAGREMVALERAMAAAAQATAAQAAPAPAPAPASSF
jgi:hypothetical protein